MKNARLSLLALLPLISCGDDPVEFEPWPDGAQFYVGSSFPDTALAFSPLGEILLFCSANSGNPGIYGFDGIADPSLRTFTEYNEFVGPTGCWHADSGRIVFAAVRDDGSGELRWMPGNLYEVHLLLYDSLPNMQPSWSPLADSVVYASRTDGSWGLWHGAMSSFVPTELFVDEGADCTRPSYSPDGDWVLFQRSVGGDSDIWVIRPDGTDAHAVVAWPSREIHPTWGPEGGSIAFSSDSTGNYEIYAGTIYSDEFERLTDDEASDVYPAWNPVGDWIAFSSDRVSGSLAYDIFWIPAP